MSPAAETGFMGICTTLVIVCMLTVRSAIFEPRQANLCLRAFRYDKL